MKGNMEIQGERYYTIKEAAVLLRLHWRTIWRWTVENKIEFRQVAPGHKIIISEKALNSLRKPL